MPAERYSLLYVATSNSLHSASLVSCCAVIFFPGGGRGAAATLPTTHECEKWGASAATSGCIQPRVSTLPGSRLDSDWWRCIRWAGAYLSCAAPLPFHLLYSLYKWRRSVFIVRRVARQPADGGLPWPWWTSGASFRSRRSLTRWLTALASRVHRAAAAEVFCRVRSFVFTRQIFFPFITASLRGAYCAVRSETNTGSVVALNANIVDLFAPQRFGFSVEFVSIESGVGTH